MSKVFFFRVLRSKRTEDLDERDVGAELARLGLFHAGDRVRLKKLREMPTGSMTSEDYEAFRRGLELQEEDHLIVCDVRSVALSFWPLEIMEIVNLLRLRGPTREEFGCGEPTCEIHGGAVRAAILQALIYAESLCALCPHFTQCPAYDW